MKKILLILLLLLIPLFAETTIYTEGRHYSTVDEDGNLLTDGNRLIEDRSKFTFDDDCTMFVHNTNTGTVRESTYWITPGTIELLDNGFICSATSDVGNKYQYIITDKLVIIILKTYDDESSDIVSFNVKNVIKDNDE